ncbi:hypothetical protein DFS34DRAFT_678317 [Phlyctochytrium arcticum]|nr:hypothetical protein DFS34DRAFT_678317 [Phlyctochytrium arcticum]
MSQQLNPPYHHHHVRPPPYPPHYPPAGYAQYPPPPPPPNHHAHMPPPPHHGGGLAPAHSSIPPSSAHQRMPNPNAATYPPPQPPMVMHHHAQYAPPPSSHHPHPHEHQHQHSPQSQQQSHQQHLQQHHQQPQAPGQMPHYAHYPQGSNVPAPPRPMSNPHGSHPTTPTTPRAEDSNGARPSSFQQHETSQAPTSAHPPTSQPQSHSQKETSHLKSLQGSSQAGNELPEPTSPITKHPTSLNTVVVSPTSPDADQDDLDDGDLNQSGALQPSAGTTSSGTTSTGIPDFVKKLFRMLEDTSYSDIVSWGVHGDTFVVKEPNEFAKNVLPKHFKHNNPASFVRQLNKYGFHKIKSQDDGRLYGDQAWEFQHPNFQYNKKEKLDSIRRKTPASKPKVTTAPNSHVPAIADSLTTELRKDTNDLQTQVDSLTRLQSDIAAYLQGLSRNYRMVVEEILNFRKNMVAQDQVIRNLVDYIVGKDADSTEKFHLAGTSRMGLPSVSAPVDSQSPSSRMEESPFITPFAFTKTSIPSSSSLSQASHSLQPDLNMNTIMNPSALDLPKDQAQKLLDTYQEVARASFHQMNEISRHVQEAYSVMGTSAPPSTFGQAANSLSAEDLSSLDSSLRLNAGSANSGAGAHGFSKSHPGPTLQQTQKGGLTVFTLGGFTPRREDNSDSSDGSSSSGNSNRPPNSMRVTRATFVPPWSVPPKVLLVEDDITCRKLSSKLLQVFGCAFDVAVDGLDAVERMGVGNKYDIVLMDIVMPNLDGVTATNRIRQFDQLTPIISMTSNTTANDCMTYLANGMNDILAKPFNKHSMLSMIERYCNHLVVQRAAALGVPRGPRLLTPGDAGRIEELDDDESQNSSNLRKTLLNSVQSFSQQDSNFTDMLNMPVGELGGLGIQPFGMLSNNYLQDLDLSAFDPSAASQSQQSLASDTDGSSLADSPLGTPNVNASTSSIMDEFTSGMFSGMSTADATAFNPNMAPDLSSNSMVYSTKRSADEDPLGSGSGKRPRHNT